MQINPAQSFILAIQIKHVEEFQGDVPPDALTMCCDMAIFLTVAYYHFRFG